MIASFNTAVNDTIKEVFETQHHEKKPWATNEALNLCDQETGKWTQRAVKYKAINRKIWKMMQANENEIENQCEDILTRLSRNYTKKAYQLMKDLTKEKKQQQQKTNKQKKKKKKKKKKTRKAYHETKQKMS